MKGLVVGCRKQIETDKNVDKIKYKTLLQLIWVTTVLIRSGMVYYYYYYLVFCLTTGPYEQDPSFLFSDWDLFIYVLGRCAIRVLVLCL
jgi:hypothetical protein